VTAQTVPFLKNTLLASGQAAGSITPTRMQDIPDSFPPWDDPANASGLGAPAILRGTVNAYSLSGLTIGAGQTTTVRQNNATALNNAFTYCQANGKYFEMPGGTYEINAAGGLIAPATGGKGLTIRGEYNAASIVQYAVNAPILTVGDPTNTTFSQNHDISGLILSYGVSGQTSVAPLVLGSQTMSVFQKIKVGNYGAAGGGFSQDAVSIPSVFFSNRVYDLEVTNFSRYGLNIVDSGSTSNSFDNIYMTNAADVSGAGACSAYIQASASHGNFFTRLNCEWASTNTAINLAGGIGFGDCYVFNDVHFEGVKLTGANPCFFLGNASTVLVNGLDLTNCTIQSANLTGSPALIYDYQGGWSGSYKIQNLYINPGNTSGLWAVPVFLYRGYNNALDDWTSNVEISGGHVIDNNANDVLTNRLAFDSKMPVATFRSPMRWTRYVYGPAYSKVERAMLQISSTYTHYGQYEDAVIVVPNSITSFTITLATTMGASGTQKVRTGNTVRIRRQSGTAAGTLTVAFGGTGTPSTNTTAPADLWYVFDGTNWQTFTPVTS
jgi:hypothetical protein